MIDHDSEDMIPFVNAGQHIHGRPSRCTLFRWAFKGVRGVKLETLLIGNQRFTSKEAIARFIAAQNPDQAAPNITPSQRQRQSLAARRELEKMDI